MPLQGAFLIQLTSNFMSRLNFTIEKKKSFIRRLAVNGSQKWFDFNGKKVCCTNICNRKQQTKITLMGLKMK